MTSVRTKEASFQLPSLRRRLAYRTPSSRRMFSALGVKDMLKFGMDEVEGLITVCGLEWGDDQVRSPVRLAFMCYTL
jgi:hypothetical protein